jgi:O-antigen/teichoic acid export membrane protein
MRKKQSVDPLEPARYLRRRSLSAARWTASQTLLVALLGPITSIAKARFLSPAELGAVAVFMIVYGLLHTIESAGLSQTIVQKEELSGEDRFTLLVAAVTFGLVGWFVLWIGANWIDRLFGVPGARPLLAPAGALLLLAMVDQYFRSLLHRDLVFRGAAITEVAKRVANLAVLLVLLSLGFGPLSVVYALIVASGFAAIALIFLALRHGQLDHLSPGLSRSALQHLGSFGLPIALKQVFTYFTHRADEVVVALALSPGVLGAYHLAKETLGKIRALITNSFSRVLLPLFAKLRDDAARLDAVYERITVLVSYAGISTFIMIALLAPDLVPAVFGPDWHIAVPAFQILSIALIPIVLTANISTSLLYALGKPNSVLLVDLALNIPYLFILYLATGYGLTAILITYACFCFVKAGALQALSNKNLHISGRRHATLYGRVLLRVGAMATSIIALTAIADPGWHAGIRAALGVTVGAAVLVGVTALSDHRVITDIRLLLEPALRRAPS